MIIFYHACTNRKKVRVAIFTLDKTDFRAKSLPRQKKSHFVMIKGKIHQKNTTRNLNI